MFWQDFEFFIVLFWAECQWDNMSLVWVLQLSSAGDTSERVDSVRVSWSLVVGHVDS